MSFIFSHLQFNSIFSVLNFGINLVRVPFCHKVIQFGTQKRRLNNYKSMILLAVLQTFLNSRTRARVHTHTHKHTHSGIWGTNFNFKYIRQIKIYNFYGQFLAIHFHVKVINILVGFTSISSDMIWVWLYSNPLAYKTSEM